MIRSVSMWYSIEVFDGSSAALLWSEAHGDSLVEHALGTGATDWSWHQHSWGIVFEVAFEQESDWERFHQLAAVLAALDAVPDPLTGLIMYRGRGGSAGASMPRPRRPLIGAGSAALPLPIEWVPDTTEVWSLLGDAIVRPLITVGRRA